MVCGVLAHSVCIHHQRPLRHLCLSRSPHPQVCGGYPDAMAHVAQLIEEHVDASFVDVNMGCPIDLICNRQAGEASWDTGLRVYSP